VSQHKESISVLELIQKTLDCGYIKPNHLKNTKDLSYVFVVRSRDDLINKVIPFFETYELRTSKKLSFDKFSFIVKAMWNNSHRDLSVFKELVKVAFSMNYRNGSYRKLNISDILKSLEPSETIRRKSIEKINISND